MRLIQRSLPLLDCNSGGNRLELVRFNGDFEQIVAYVNSRCNNPPQDGEDNLLARNNGGLLFDPVQGTLLVQLKSQCSSSSCSDSGGPIPSYQVEWTAAIQGFATTFEILQSYEPAPAAFSFRVPYMPEGFPAADSFDAYFGELANPIDFTKAQPLQCDFPRGPMLGDYLTVTDLPTPPVGHGYYFVTAANYMGETRYGRQRVGGVLSGRDPAVLPACVEE